MTSSGVRLEPMKAGGKQRRVHVLVRVVVPCLLVVMIVLNIVAVINDICTESSTLDAHPEFTNRRRLLTTSSVQKVSSILPFCSTAFYFILYQACGQKNLLLVGFCDFFTFLGFPLTALQFINLSLCGLKMLFGISNTGYFVFPVSFFSWESVAIFFCQGILTTGNFITLLCLMTFQKCVSSFKPQVPILMFALLFGGVLLDRIALIDTSRVLSEDYKFVCSLFIQILIVDVVLILLSLLGSPISAKDEETQSFVQATSIEANGASPVSKESQIATKLDLLRAEGLVNFVPDDEMLLNV